MDGAAPLSSDPGLAWKAAGACVTGPAHTRQGIGCQDAAAWRVTTQGWVLAAVCDGAGSARQPDLGAGTLARALVIALDDLPTGPAQEKAARARIEGVVQAVRHTLAADGALEDFHATLLYAAIGPAGGWFAHIGDGAGVALDAALHVVAASPPANGEYANETYFFSQEDWRDHLRLTLIPPEAAVLLMVSDGTSAFALARGQRAPHLPFLNPVHRWLLAAPPDRAQAGLQELLSRADLDRISDDDRTLIWAARVGLMPG